MTSWLEELTDAYSDSSIPPQFVYWAGIAAISAVVKDQVCLDRFFYKVFLNEYILFVAESGSMKSAAVDIAASLAAEVNNNRILNGRFTLEHIIDDLSQAHTFEDGRPPLTTASGFWPASELTSCLVDSASLTTMRALYDTNNNQKVPWVYGTRKQGKVRLNKPCITLLGATTPKDFNDFFKEIDLEGGFIARTVLVMETQLGKRNPLLEPPENMVSIPKLARHLKDISQLKGEFQWTEEGKDVFRAWHADFNPRAYEDPTGTVNRIEDHILKLAMIHALSREARLRLDGPDISKAIELILGQPAPESAEENISSSTLRNSARMSTNIHSTPVGKINIRVIETLMKEPDLTATKRKVLARNKGHFDIYELDRALETLNQAGAVEMFRKDKEFCIKLTERFLDHYQDFEKSKEERSELWRKRGLA